MNNFRKMMDAVCKTEHQEYIKKWKYFDNIKDNFIANSKDIEQYIKEDFDNGFGSWINLGIVKNTKGFEKQEEKSFIKDNEKFIIYIWQTTGFAGDNYSGEILFPLKNGNFWKISYSM